MNRVWSDTTVGDESLTQCISEIRRALGDKSQRIIKTIARRGYLIDVPISTHSGTSLATLTMMAAPTVAVLLFAVAGSEDG